MYEVYMLLMSESRTSLHCHRHPCQLCLPACPSKVIGRVSTTSCLYIQFSEDGFLSPIVLRYLPAICMQPPPIRAQCLRRRFAAGVLL